AIQESDEIFPARRLTREHVRHLDREAPADEERLPLVHVPFIEAAFDELRDAFRVGGVDVLPEGFHVRERLLEIPDVLRDHRGFRRRGIPRRMIRPVPDFAVAGVLGPERRKDCNAPDGRPRTETNPPFAVPMGATDLSPWPQYRRHSTIRPSTSFGRSCSGERNRTTARDSSTSTVSTAEAIGAAAWVTI